jgi:hypothetical protein
LTLPSLALNDSASIKTKEFEMIGRNKGRFQLLTAQILAFAALLISSSPALAQSKGTQEAKRHFDIGQALYLQGKFAAAAVRFDQAYKAKPFPAFLFNRAVCHEKKQSVLKSAQGLRAVFERGCP